MISISTKTGDTGESGLANGERASKADPVFAVIGSLDELNSWLGLVAVKMEPVPSSKDERSYIFTIQDTLFHVGAEVARSPKAHVTEAQVDELEKRSNTLQAQLAEGWHTKFLLPGGTELGAWLDIARTVCRRCERELVQYHHHTPVSPILIKYLNRLSDYLYMVRCFVNAVSEYKERQFEISKKQK